jgi:hypothetical protein
MISRKHTAAPVPLARRVVVLLVCLSLGMHWSVLQGIAWTGMLISNLAENSVVEAVEKTFDGEHPCPLCLAVKEGQKKEKDDSKPVAAKSVKKFEAVLLSEKRLLSPSGLEMSFVVFLTKNALHVEETAKPPPRAV